MVPPQEVLELFGWRTNGIPNIADKGSRISVNIAAAILEELNVDRRSTEKGQTMGRNFERAISQILEDRLQLLDEDRPWVVGSQKITDFAQYAHLAHVRWLAEADPTLRSSLGTDYLIKPDITVGIDTDALHHLHAAVSCKWTIRSDRVQNIRHEGVVLTRHRRGRQPHFVAVTAEPLPSRLAAIARGTGELDCVYHVALQQLRTAAHAVGSQLTGRRHENPFDTLEELIEQDRLRPFDDLPYVIAHY
ncbi:MAG: restriction endonuclease [Acidobacteria bacterium]|nr:restriction endonuclease [Acidobacteriota bacterium]